MLKIQNIAIFTLICTSDTSKTPTCHYRRTNVTILMSTFYGYVSSIFIVNQVWSVNNSAVTQAIGQQTQIPGLPHSGDCLTIKTTLACDGQTDRQTDRQTELLHEYCALHNCAMLTHNKNKALP